MKRAEYIASRDDMLHQRFGRLVPQKWRIYKSGEQKRVQYFCKCDCGAERWIYKNAITQRSMSASCGCARKEAQKVAMRRIWDARQEISRIVLRTRHWRQIVNNADTRGHELSISMEQAQKIYNLQQGRCALSGLPIFFQEKTKNAGWTASLDRIDSSAGYVMGNLQWVHKDVNLMKQAFSQARFAELCQLVADGICR